MERPDGGVVRDAIHAALGSVGVRNHRIGACCLYHMHRASGSNSLRTHPLALKFGKNPHAISLHAEVAALIASKWRATQLVVVRIRRDGSWGNAHPCTGCMRAIEMVGCRCWYSTGVGQELTCLR